MAVVQADVELMSLRAEEQELMHNLQETDHSKLPEDFDHEHGQVGVSARPAIVCALGGSSCCKHTHVMQRTVKGAGQKLQDMGAECKSPN